MSRIEKLNDATGQGEFLDEIVPVKYLFSTNTASTASDGDLQFDDATYSSAANIYVNKNQF